MDLKISKPAEGFQKTFETEMAPEPEPEIITNLEDEDEDIETKCIVPGSGKTVTLQMLLSANILQPGKSTMTIEYLGQKFIGDLLENGKIKSLETETIFLTPSAWALHCKKIINPEKKSGCGWASVKYKGKKLDAYKTMWQKKMQQQKEHRDSSPTEDDEDKETESILPSKPVKRDILQHSNISNRNIPHDSNSLVQAVPFTSIGKIQPFLVTITSSAALLMDFHCHLTNNEVCGYFGGSFDFNSHNLSITEAFPVLNSKYDREKASECELNIQKDMIQKNCSLVGWYHSHPRFSVEPTLRDCDSQLEYQIKMRGASDNTYTPVIGFICSTYDEEHSEQESQMMAFWVIPPIENTNEYARPMSMTYSIKTDQQLPENIKDQMQDCVNYYKQFPNELIDFAIPLKDELTFVEMLKCSVFTKFPKEESGELWNWMRELFGLEREETVEIPKSVLEKVKREKEAEKQPDKMKEGTSLEDEAELAAKATLNAMSCLQQQLSQPSGLNMTPSPISSSIILPTPANNQHSSTNTSSPRDSPLTIPSTSASPAANKFEMPRASPSPAKSDASSQRTRNSPAPSPGKHNLANLKYDGLSGLNSGNINDIYAATLASLASKLPPGMLPGDYSSLLAKMPDYGSMSALGSLSASAAALSSSNPSGHSSSKKDTYSQPSTSSTSQSQQNQQSWLSQIPNMKEFMAQLEKGDLSVLMQSPYNIPSCKPTKAEKSRNLPEYHPPANPGPSHEGQSTGKRKGRPPHVFEYDDYKSEAGKIADLMKSPEYTQMLLQQAQAFRGLGSEITVTRKPNKKQSQSMSSAQASQSAQNLLQQMPVMDLNYLAEASKSVPELSALLHSNKPEDINALLQMQMMSKNSMQDYASLFGGKNSKAMQEYAAAAASSLQYMSGSKDFSSLFGPMYGMDVTGSSSGNNEKQSSRKKEPKPSSYVPKTSQTTVAPNAADMLNSLFTGASKASDINTLLYGKQDLSSYFGNQGVSSSGNTQTTSKINNSTSGGGITSAFDYSSLFSTMSPAKLQEMSSMFSQGKYPDPLAKTTLAANNLYLSPSLMKLQQEALNTMMMKPPHGPKSSSSSSSSKNDTPPISEKRSTPTPTKSRNSPAIQPPNPKYNFNAVDLAVSSCSPSNAPLASSPNLATDFSRKSTPTPPVEQPIVMPIKKRMEFSSIAELIGPSPAKQPKYPESESTEDSGVLNLSNN